MVHSELHAPLFPLNAHVLPGGRLRLRIFEPRYVRMVKEACAGKNQGYIAMAMLNEAGNRELNRHIHPIATLATVIDFETLDDGLLGITVQAERCAVINEVHTESDGLRVGSLNPVENWPQTPLTAEDKFLAEQLQQVYQSYPELEGSKCQQYFDAADWVCYRWLELLPVQAQVKQELLNSECCEKTLSYLRQLIQENTENT